MNKVKILSFVALFFILVGSVGLDITTKNMAEKKLLQWSSPSNLREYQGESIPVFSLGQLSPIHGKESFFVGFSLTYVRNQGAAWGMLSDLHDTIRVPFFHLVTLIAVLIIFYYLWTTPFNHRLARFAFVLILSGAIGNFADRVRLGYVIDFLDVHWTIPLPFALNFNVNFFPKILDFLNFSVNTSVWSYDFPKFNWADSMITIGVACLIFDMLVLEPRRRKNPSNYSETVSDIC